MNDHMTLTTLFSILRGCLPYEYDELYINGENMDHSIVINKKDSELTMYITMNAPDDNDILDTDLYDNYDDDLIETCQWDLDDPNLNLTDLITYIKNSL